MVALAAGSVVLVAFPFSDLPGSKLRPAIALAPAGRGDWILCQITSNPYSDPFAIPIEARDFARGSLIRLSFARPGRLFTASSSLVEKEIARLKPSSLANVIDAVVDILRSSQDGGACDLLPF